MADTDTDFLDELMHPTATEETDEAEEREEPATPEVTEAAQTVEEPETPAPEATTAPEVKEDKTVPLPALLAEREKRQALERQLEELRQQQPQQPVPEFWEAPEVHLQQIEQRANQRLFAALEEQAKAVYPDYDDMVDKALEAAQANPILAQQVMAAPNPALAMYQLGKNTKEAELLKDPATLRAQLEAEIRAKLEAEFAEKQRAKAAAAAAVPPDLSQARNAAGQFAPAAPNPIDEVFPR